MAETQMDLTENIQTKVQTDVPLTDFELQESKLEEKTGFDLPKSLDINPWVNQTPVAILEREYRLDVGTIVVPSTTDNLTYFNVYTEFSSANTQFAQMFRSFRYFRFKRLHYRVVLTTSPFIYGYLCFTMLPDLDSRDAPGDDYGWFSHDDAVLVDVCSMNEVKLSIDWPFTDNWIDVKSNHETNFNYLASLKMVYLADALKQLSATGPTGIDYQVFYRFEGVELAGFASSSVVQSQSYFGMAAGAIGSMFADTAVKYATKKVSDGVMSGMDYAEAQAKKALEQGFGSNLDGEEEVVGTPTKAASGIQTGESVSSFVPDLFGGLVCSPPRNVLGDGTVVPNFTKRKHSLLSFLMKPSLIRHEAFNTAGTDFFSMECNPFQDLKVLRPDEELVHSCSRLRFLGKFYRQWRGSITYTFVIFGSPLVAYRMLLTLKYGGLETPEMGDFYNKTFTVRGTNIVNITVPFLYPANWLHTHSTDDIFPVMRLDYEAVVGMGTTTPGPLILLYEAAEPDFQFDSRREVAPTYYVESQMLVSGLCQTAKDASNRRNVSREVDGVKTFEDMAQRWSVRATASLYPRPNYDPSLAPSSYLSIGSFDALSSLFLYYRGQIKFKITPTKSPTDSSVTWTVALDPDMTESDVNLTGLNPAIAFANGATLINVNTTQVIEFTVPFVANKDWSAFGSQSYHVSELIDYVFVPHVFVSNNSQELTYNPGIGICAISGGTDFAYSYEMPPPSSKARWYDLPALPPVRNMQKRHPRVETTNTRA